MTITKKLLITTHALLRFRQRVDPFVPERTVILAVGRARKLQPVEAAEKGLPDARDDQYFYEEARNLLFVLVDTGSQLVVKTVFHPLIDQDIPVRYLRVMDLTRELKATQNAMKNLKGGQRRADLKVRRRELLSELQRRGVRDMPY